ncbi:hypothetical protein SSX86_021213 [Deinandra increscens subsp. villosa]|uniref:RRM domain-containing protein n=1 Tax=Deinandra increscens subsp. villosa TaxID=3103831 RepID=A0AAP0GU50_9ASTR
MCGDFRRFPNPGRQPGTAPPSGRPSFHDTDHDQWLFPKRRNRGQPSNKNSQTDRNKAPTPNPNYRDLQKVSSSVFITNFPPNTTMQELWKHCDAWGRVSDVFISSRLTKSGRRFGFVRFVGVKDMKNLIANLRTLWIGSYHVYADEVRENPRVRTSSSNVNPSIPKSQQNETNVVSSVAKSFADLLKPIISSQKDVPLKPIVKKRISISLDDCIDAKTSHFLMGKVFDPLCIPNLPSLFVKEGFHEVRFRYIGGRWVGMSFPNSDLALKFDACLELKKCFSNLELISNSFVPDERCIWIDLLGLPVVASTPVVLKKVGELWGEFMFFGNDKDEPLANGKVCIITKCPSLIDETIDVDVGGKVFEVRVKEFDNWSPTLHFHEDSSSSDESVEDLELEDGEINENLDNKEEFEEMNGGEKKGDHNEQNNTSFPIATHDVNLDKHNHVEDMHDSSFSGPSKPPGFEENVKILSKSSDRNGFDGILEGDSSSSVPKINKSNGGSILQEFSKFIHMEKLIDKLKRLKEKIKSWRKTRPDPNVQILAIQKEILDIDKVLDEGHINDILGSRRCELVKKLNDLEKPILEDLAQKAKIKWGAAGDENSKLYHGAINQKRRQSAIHGLKIDGEWIENPVGIKKAFVDYFSKKFKRGNEAKLLNRSHRFRSICEASRLGLELPPSIDEVKVAVWDCGSDKAPGPDGFSFGFIKKFWDILKQDIMAFVT